MIKKATTPELVDNTFLPLLPLRNVVLLPKSIRPVIVGRESSINAVELALKGDKAVFITSQKDPNTENPSADDIFTYGTRSVIVQAMRMPNGALKILVEGLCRSKITGLVERNGITGVTFEDVPTEGLTETVELEALWRQEQQLYYAYAQLNKEAAADLILLAKNPEEIDYMTDTIAAQVNTLSFNDRQQFLETQSLRDRLLLLCTLLQKEIDILQTENRIRGRVQTQVEKNQREYYLTEQMKAINKELGREDTVVEMEKIRAKAKKIGLPAHALENVEKELKRLEQMPPMSSEAVVCRNYIDWIVSLPWTKTTKDSISITQAETILDKHHAGLVKIKERIIEFIAAKKFSKNLDRSPILCLVGPPGVGKTSLARSIAESLGRNFARISLGGIRDEAEIRGHRRTYIGALPGKILQTMKKAGTVNPVILLDEIDKMASDLHGDPAAALLEVLDPEQNKAFMDHFIDTEYDLSKVMFIATANMTEGIPYPLFDRMEIISISGYTEEEKLAIAKKFLISKNLQEYGLTAKQCAISDEILQTLINEYTREAGVRQLERIIAKLMRKVIQQLLKNKELTGVTVTDAMVKEWLGNPPFRKTSLHTTGITTGLATGLAWTESGGDVLEIETSVVPGKGGLTLTGQLGEVMQESAQAAMSYIRSRAKELQLKSSFNATKDIHIHIPEGATPKDGPSAGITICTALVSALTNNPVRAHIAMTGEVTLRGRVLSIGGLKEKLLAAKQHKMDTVILPQENFDDAQEILKETDLSSLKLIFVNNMDEVLKAACINDPFAKIENKSKTRTAMKKKKKQNKKEA